jgi:hypothetical protein
MSGIEFKHAKHHRLLRSLSVESSTQASSYRSRARIGSHQHNEKWQRTDGLRENIEFLCRLDGAQSRGAGRDLAEHLCRFSDGAKVSFTLKMREIGGGEFNSPQAATQPRERKSTKHSLNMKLKTRKKRSVTLTRQPAKKYRFLSECSF